MGIKNSPKQQQKKFRFIKHQTIGAPDAESDFCLENVFVENGEVDILEDVLNPKCIIIGRTGAGKSALIKHLEENLEKVHRIHPEAMSIKYLTNSTILNYFRNAGVNLHFFYKVLWKHVFIVEILKLFFSEDEQRRRNYLQQLKDQLVNRWGKINPAKEKAIKYLEKWTNEFWLSTEYKAKTLETQLSSRFLAETGLTSDVFKLGAVSESTSMQNIKGEYKDKAEQVINEIQAEELYEIINIMREKLLDSNQKAFYIIIDDLDKEWATPQIVYDLIAAMIEVIKEFQVFKGAKIIIALRENLNQLVFSGHQHRGGQREKFSALYLPLEWDKASLVELINKRLKFLTHNTLEYKTAFERESKTGESGFDYVLERTYLRPRDVISFVNKIIKNAHTKSFFSKNIIKNAEPEYSLERLYAIDDEWSENYGYISKSCTFLIGKYNGFKLGNLKEDDFYDLYCEDDYSALFRGDLLTILTSWKSGKLKFKAFVKEFLFILFRVGVVGLKKNAAEPIRFFYNNDIPVISADFLPDSKIYVHEALYSALKINVKALEVDYLD